MEDREYLGSCRTVEEHVIANLDDLGFFESREDPNAASNVEPSTPQQSIALPDYAFRLGVDDATATGDVLTVELDSAVEVKSVTLERVTAQGRFESKDLYLVPENFTLPPSAPQAVADSRIRGPLGSPLIARYTAQQGACEDRAITTGVLLVDPGTGLPLNRIDGGLIKDVLSDGVDKQLFQVVVGAPGDAATLADGTGVHADVPLTPSGYQDQVLTPIPTTVRAYRQSNDSTADDYNLLETIKPLLAVTAGFSAPRPTSTIVLDVSANAGGFLRAEPALNLGPIVLKSVGYPVDGTIFVNVLIDGLGAGLGSHPAGTASLQTLLAVPGTLPNFERILGPSGSSIRYFDARTTFPSITFSAWSSWATGRDPKVHGVPGSNFFRRNTFRDLFTPPASGMYPPADHLSFHGDFPIFDLDIENVLDYAQGTLNAAMHRHETCQTIYELAVAQDLVGACVYHFPFRGITSATLVANPISITAWADHNFRPEAALDLHATSLLKGLMPSPAMNPPPQLLTVYYASLDRHVHHDESYPLGRPGFPAGPSTGANFLTLTDRVLGTLVRLLKAHNLFRGAMFCITGDHGLTPVVNDSLHEMVLEYALPPNNELEDITDAAGYNVLDDFLEPTYNVVIGFNGGMAHVYVKNRSMAGWSSAPGFSADVLPLAQRFYDNAVGILADDPQEGILGAIELVLVRNAEVGTMFDEPYHVMYRSLGWHGTWTYVTTQQALSVTVNGRPLVPAGYVDFVKNIDRLRDIRSGDIILMANFTPERTAMEPDGTGVWTSGGYYFGEALPGWHGSLYDTDMTIPIIFSYPEGQGSALAAFLSTVNQKMPAAPSEPSRITDITPATYKVLTEEDY